jgi:hypothetical protein
MALNMSSLIGRHLRHAEGYVRFVEGRGLPVDLDCRGERVIGWYQNPPPFESECVVFSEVAVYISSPMGWVRASFDDIEDYELPEDKANTPGVRIRTRGGIGFIRFAGRSGLNRRYSDAFSLVQVLHMVVLVNRRKGVSREQDR